MENPRRYYHREEVRDDLHFPERKKAPNPMKLSLFMIFMA